MLNGISVVIPNYNGVQLLPEILPTVFTALRNIQLPGEVIVSDDCSTDESIDFLQTYFPQIRIVSNTINSGFSATANNGVKNAHYNVVLLLNSDVKLEPDYFKHQLHYFERDDTFGVMGRIVGWEDDKIQDGAKYPFFHGVKIKTSGNYLLKDEEEMQKGLYTMYLSGANALFDKSKFLKLGGFNEFFSPFYVEDYELSLRAWRVGWKCYYDHQSVCRHKTSVTIQSKNKKNEIRKIYNRNKMFLHGIHLPPGKRYIYFLQVFFEAIVKSITGKFFYLSSIRLFLKSYSRVRASREELLRKAEGKLLSVKEVTETVINSVRNKAIKRF
jgi:GT2 family glycosyltransferase